MIIPSQGMWDLPNRVHRKVLTITKSNKIWSLFRRRVCSGCSGVFGVDPRRTELPPSEVEVGFQPTEDMNTCTRTEVGSMNILVWGLFCLHLGLMSALVSCLTGLPTAILEKYFYCHLAGTS